MSRVRVGRYRKIFILLQPMESDKKEISEQELTKLLDSLSIERRRFLWNCLETTVPIEEACPSLKELLNKIEHEDLSADHLQLAQNFCIELSKNRDSIPRFTKEVSKISKFTERLLLYSSETFEIRVHIFSEGADETFIHDHQIRFISCCLQGEYLHKLHSAVGENGTYYTFTRKSGGIYSDGIVTKGTPSAIVAQPFKAGQCLFLSEHAFHTVTQTSKEQVVTVTFRDLRPKKHEATIWSSENKIDKEQKASKVEDPSIIFKNFQAVLEHYNYAILVNCPPPPPAILHRFANLETMLSETQELLHQISLGTSVDRVYHTQLKAYLCGILFSGATVGIALVEAQGLYRSLDWIIGIYGSGISSKRSG